MAIQAHDKHIEITPGIAGGRPRIAGRRITVNDIVIWHQRLGKSVDEICAEHDLGPADVHAALTYYFDHREEIDRSIKECGNLVENLRRTTPSALEKRLKEHRGE